MNKIPVGQTIRFAYAFTFGEIGTIIGLIWIPTLVNAIAGFFATGTYYRALADSMESGLPPMGTAATLPIVLAFVSLLLLAMISVAITQQALGLREGPAFAHISLGSAELRTFGGFFGLYLLLVLFAMVFLVVVGAIAIGAGSAIKAMAGATPLITAVSGLAVLIGILVLVYMIVRLSFLLVPSVVDGREFGLTRSWQLTKGNFWRIVAIGVVTILPVTLVFGAVEFAILGPDFYKPDLTSAKGTTASLHLMAQQLRAMETHMPALMGLSFVISPVLYGLAFAPAAFAYRALTGQGVPRTRA